MPRCLACPFSWAKDSRVPPGSVDLFPGLWISGDTRRQVYWLKEKGR